MRLLYSMLWLGGPSAGGILPCGSGFIASFQGKEYVVTASHVLRHLASDRLHIRYKMAWNEHSYNVLVDSDELDVAVLECSGVPVRGDLSQRLVYGTAGLTHGQIGYALGFPSMDGRTNYVAEDTQGRPMAIPTMLSLNIPSLGKIQYSGAYINNGYSGGAIAFYDQDERRWSICGVITSFPTIRREVESVDGRSVIGYVRQHMGLIGYRSWNAVEHLLEVALR